MNLIWNILVMSIGVRLYLDFIELYFFRKYFRNLFFNKNKKYHYHVIFLITILSYNQQKP